VGERVELRGFRTARVAAALLLALALLATACGAPRTYTADPGPYDRVPREWDEPLERARLAFERGDLHTAYLEVTPLTLESGRVLPVRTFLQEIELALLVEEGEVGGLKASSPAEAREVLALQYVRVTRSTPTPEAFVLAARLAANEQEALSYLEVAEAQDPRCVWVQYARAWWHHRERRFKLVREDLRKALRIDGGHLPSMRLHATMLAGAGDYEDAERVLALWLERTGGDPLFASTERADAMLDLAALEVLLDSPKKALELLEDLDPRAVRDPVRAQTVLAAAYEARGDYTRTRRGAARDAPGADRAPADRAGGDAAALGRRRRGRARGLGAPDGADRDRPPDAGGRGAVVGRLRGRDLPPAGQRATRAPGPAAAVTRRRA